MAAQAKSTKSPKSTRSSKKTVTVDTLPEQLIVQHADSAMIGSDAAGEGLDALLADLEPPTALGDAPIDSDVVIEESHSDTVLESAIAGAEATEAALAVATPEGVVDPGAVPTGTTSDVPAAEAAAPEAKPKRVATPRKFYSNRADRLVDRMGAGLVEYTVLTMEDAGVTEEELQAKMNETLDIIRGMAKKKQNRASMFIEFVAGKKAKPNAILDCTLKVLARDGHISTGKEGNVFQSLLKDHSYDPASARAMGGNTISMLEDLKVLVADGKQKFVANPASLLLMKANSLLFPAADAVVETEPEAAAA